MTRERSATLPLLLLAGGAAVALGALLALREPPQPPLHVGGAAPAFRLPRLDGSPVVLAELRGSVVFVNFWGTWCAPCREEAPSLERLHRALREEGFVVLGVSIDAPGAQEEVRVFREEHGLSFPILLDPGQETYARYGATGVPETFLIDREGRMIERFVGPRDWDDPRYTRAVRRLLEQTHG